MSMCKHEHAHTHTLTLRLAEFWPEYLPSSPFLQQGCLPKPGFIKLPLKAAEVKGLSEALDWVSRRDISQIISQKRWLMSPRCWTWCSLQRPQKYLF